MTTPQWRHTTPLDIQPADRSVLDRAEGVLIMLRRYEPQAAFTELVGASRRHGVPVFALAGALLEMTCGPAGVPATVPEDARRAAQQEWARLLP